MTHAVIKPGSHKRYDIISYVVISLENEVFSITIKVQKMPRNFYYVTTHCICVHAPQSFAVNVARLVA